MREQIEAAVTRYRQQRAQTVTEIQQYQAVIDERTRLVYSLDGAIAALSELLNEGKQAEAQE